jgi:hypothetical protein
MTKPNSCSWKSIAETNIERYAEMNVGFWHESEVPALPAYVGSRGKTGQHMLNASSSHFDQLRHKLD